MHQGLQGHYLCDNMPGMLNVQGNVKSWHVSDINYTEELLKFKLDSSPQI